VNEEAPLAFPAPRGGRGGAPASHGLPRPSWAIAPAVHAAPDRLRGRAQEGRREAQEGHEGEAPESPPPWKAVEEDEERAVPWSEPPSASQWS